MVLVVPSVQVHVVGVEEQVREQQQDNLDGLLPPIHKVPVEDVGRLGRRESVLDQWSLAAAVSS